MQWEKDAGKEKEDFACFLHLEAQDVLKFLAKQLGNFKMHFVSWLT